jgi:hypothetical protein
MLCEFLDSSFWHSPNAGARNIHELKSLFGIVEKRDPVFLEDPDGEGENDTPACAPVYEQQAPVWSSCPGRVP